MPNILGTFSSSSKAWSFRLDVSCHLGKSIPFHQLKCQNFEANPSALHGSLESRPQKLADQHRHHVIFLWSIYDWEEGRKSIAMVSLRSKQFVASSHQFVLGPPKKQPEDFATLRHHGNGKIRNETWPHLPGLRKSDRGKKTRKHFFLLLLNV